MEPLATLVVRARGGDKEAFATIVHRFQDMAVGYGYVLLHDMHLAEDAAQEAFLNAYFILPQLREPAAFPGWFRTIVRKQCDRFTRQPQLTTTPLETATMLAGLGDDPARAVEQKELRVEVAAALASLPPRLRTVTTLFYIGAYSHMEIAAFLDIPVGTVKTRLHTARKRLHERLITVINDNLTDQRPSRNDNFANRVMRLFVASETGDVDTVASMLDEEPTLANRLGAVHDRLYIGEAPPLHVAVMYNQRAVIDLLLARGADINQQDKVGHTALTNAIDLSFLPDYDWRGMVDFLEARGARHNAFSFMWMNDLDRLAEYLQAHPGAVNERGPGGSTLLCFSGSPEMVSLLLDHGADMYARLDNEKGLDTPIRFLARFPGNALRSLLEHGSVPIDPYLQCVLGDTQLAIVAVEADSTLVTIPTQQDHVLGGGIMLTHLATHYGRLDLLRVLLDQGAGVNARGRSAAGHGRSGMLDLTPLHVAATTGQFEPARVLIAYGANLHATAGPEQTTPLQFAEALYADWLDRTEVTAVLREALSGPTTPET